MAHESRWLGLTKPAGPRRTEWSSRCPRDRSSSQGHVNLEGAKRLVNPSGSGPRRTPTFQLEPSQIGPKLESGQDWGGSPRAKEARPMKAKSSLDPHGHVTVVVTQIHAI
ncbi:hypothetical protein CRG98_001869 [Punica granatum]|uniref:Uncharacterized protein n=1 Tax=Punica granatum TaxID=22663 RepID=A0A2I0LAP1_PUNGR|nr:hypothetical protein CRG98_001869 [Punica granatum]